MSMCGYTIDILVSFSKAPIFKVYNLSVFSERMKFLILDGILSNSLRKRLILAESVLPFSFSNQNVEILSKRTKMRNATGTTDDSIEYDGKKYCNMIELWEILTEEAAPSCVNEKCQSSPHEANDVVGAHVVKSGENTDLNHGDKVFIIPLCRKCNHCGNNTPIILKRDTPAVVLRWTK